MNTSRQTTAIHVFVNSPLKNPMKRLQREISAIVEDIFEGRAEPGFIVWILYKAAWFFILLAIIATVIVLLAR